MEDIKFGFSGFKPAESHQSTCPSCGYCPHCGRGGYHTYPYPYYSGPWIYPYTYWNTTTTATVEPISNG